MSAVLVELSAEHTTVTADGVVHRFAAGVATLAATISGDPPLPEDLTNAIGLMRDHLDDADREIPALASVDSLTLRGPGVDVICAVEVGHTPPDGFRLSHDAAEDVFRTVATEPVAARALNPGLPVAWRHDVVGACCAVVAVFRHFVLPDAAIEPVEPG